MTRSPERNTGRRRAPSTDAADASADLPVNPGLEDVADDLAGGPVTHFGGFELSPFQVQAVEAVRQGKNVLVAAPTGAGKTLVAEYAMKDAVLGGRRCIYTSPIKALSNQKYRDFRDDPAVDAGIMTGDVTLNPAGSILIMTTEILRNAIFENPALLADVEYVIFDEVHYMDDRERGSVWEESLIFLPRDVRLICLSATVSNVDEVGAWIEEIRPQALEVVRSTRRPVPLSVWMYTEREGAFPLSRVERVKKRVGREQQASAPARGRRGRGRGGSGRREPRGKASYALPDPRKLFDLLGKEDLLPALVFCFSRRDCERLARRNEFRELLSPAERERMELLQAELIGLFQVPESTHDGELFAMARRGVCYHHAGMLPIEKELVERMFTAGLLKLLFTTETFALGINMPARTAVFHDLRKFDGISFDWLRTRDFMQMAGRAGRQGIDEKGFVYCLLGDREVIEAPLVRIVSGNPEPVVSRFRLAYSTILHLVARLGRERVHEAWEKSFHQFQGRDRNQHARDKQRRIQRRILDAHFGLLDELAYLDGEELTARGRTACLLNGFELAVTELLFRGYLEDLTPRALAVVFVGIIHEERRRGERPWVSSRLFGDLRHRVGALAAELGSMEARFGIQPPTKRPDWGLTAATLAWFDGADFHDLEEETEAPPGDLVRAFRMSVQLMRNVRRAIDPEWDLQARLREALETLNRDEVDARRQLELG